MSQPIVVVAGLNADGMTLYEHLKKDSTLQVFGLDFYRKEVWKKLNPTLPKNGTVNLLYLSMENAVDFSYDAIATIELLNPEEVVIVQSVPFDFYEAIVSYCEAEKIPAKIQYDSRLAHRKLEEYEW